MFGSVGAFGSSSFEIASIENQHHITADRTLYHSKEKIYEAFGHVVVSAKGKRLSCDYLWLDETTLEMKAKGNVIFVDASTTVQAAEMHFNMNTGLGSIFYGKVSNDLYSLKGQLIRKVSEDRFLTTEGEYTTCKDCAESWKVSARNVDLTVDGYAFMDNLYIKIKDIPTLYLPYLILPAKTRRQSGLLFPKIGLQSGNHGFIYVQPFFWAISEHQDATISAGKYSARGNRFEFEHRYKSYDGIQGILNVYRTEDRKYRFRSVRTAIKALQEFPISKNLSFKFRAYEISDRDYLADFSGDIPGLQLPTLESGALAYARFNEFFFSADFKRYRNLLYDSPLGFDGGTVQPQPTLHLGIKERRLAGPIFGNVYARYDSFRRTNGPFFDKNNNREFDLGQDSLREVQRTILSPELSAPFPAVGFMSFNPSVQYNEIRYDFSVPTARGPVVDDSSTRYLLAKMNASTTVERVYAYNGKKVNRLKHLLVPHLTFSNIPWLERGSAGHPFNADGGQLDKANGKFDQFDIVPLTNDTDFLRFPQGKSITYGINSSLIRRFKTREEMGPREYPYDQIVNKPKTYPKPLNRKQELAIENEKMWDQYQPRYDLYNEVWTLNISQSYDFKNAENLVDKKRAFSYLLAKSNLSIDNFTHSLEYRFFPRAVKKIEDANGFPRDEAIFSNKHFISSSISWEFSKFSNLRGTRTFSRSISMSFTHAPQPSPSRTISGGLNWSVNDFVNIGSNYAYDIYAKRQSSWDTNLMLKHYSECWGLSLRYDWVSSREPARSNFGFELLWNPFGFGFQGTTQLAESQGAAAVFGGAGGK
jgi:lipopolysaccharide assembly outer membrane protein LptD (OstA)